MKYYCLKTGIFIALALHILQGQASHIVGGEIRMRYVSKETYQLQVLFFFDGFSTTTGNELIDAQILIGIYQKNTHQLIERFALIQQLESTIAYNEIECQNEELAIRLVQYGLEATLSESLYNAPEGYYIIWERCCRNARIANIKNPEQVGNTFYLEFPAIKQNNTSIINSSPEFLLPAGEYLCLDKEALINFSATDKDGDRLIYSLITPLAGTSFPGTAMPAPPAVYPQPIPEVAWENDFNANSAIPGNPALGISSTGILRVKPSRQGLFVFSIRCEEFRGSRKIGEVHRDYQFLVVSRCDDNKAPFFDLVLGNGTIYDTSQVITIRPEETGCYQLDIQDENIGDSIYLSAQAINFTGVAAVFPQPAGVIGGDKKLQLQVCFIRCPESLPSNNEPLEVDIIASDNGCPFKALYIKRVQVIALPVEPVDILLTTSLSENTAEAIIGAPLIFQISMEASPFNLYRLYATGKGFDLSAKAMNFPEKIGFAPLSGEFSWVPECKDLPLSEDGSSVLEVDFRAEDLYKCVTEKVLTVRLYSSANSFDTKNAFVPNIFTPNGDEQNETFSLMENAPADNCRYSFQGIWIFNRWGKEIFKSQDRSFRWDAKGAEGDIYYYMIDYKNAVVKGWVELVK